MRPSLRSRRDAILLRRTDVVCAWNRIVYDVEEGMLRVLVVGKRNDDAVYRSCLETPLNLFVNSGVSLYVSEPAVGL